MEYMDVCPFSVGNIWSIIYLCRCCVAYNIGMCNNTLRPRQNSHLFPDDIFKWIFLNNNVWISLRVSLKFVPKVRIINIPALVKIMAWLRPGDKPLYEPTVVSLLTHICVTWPHWDKNTSPFHNHRDIVTLIKNTQLHKINLFDFYDLYTWVPFNKQGLIWIPTRINDHMPSKVCTIK